jgi:hypothetical protein
MSFFPYRECHLILESGASAVLLDSEQTAIYSTHTLITRGGIQ